MIVPSLRPPFLTVFMPLVPGFWAAFRLRFVVLFRCCFYWLFLLATIAGCLVIDATISKAVPSTSPAATASSPLARAFTLLFLWSAFF
jgi:hypothetical protein